MSCLTDSEAEDSSSVDILVPKETLSFPSSLLVPLIVFPDLQATYISLTPSANSSLIYASSLLAC
jgi:hypothetical protein